MTIPYEIKVGGKLSPERKKEAERIIQAGFSEINATFNNWNPLSEISQLSQLKSFTKKPISLKLKNLILLAQKVNLLSQGRFDPTVSPLSSLWKESLKKGKLPHEDSTIMASLGCNKIHIESDLFWKESDQTALDLGGIAKGYGVDIISEKLAENGFKNIFVEWGGEIRTIGPHPSGRKWKIAIRGVGIVEFQDCALATSGDYLQMWSVDGVKYTHIIDPRTKKPLIIRDHSIASTSVLAPTCAEADAIATALMLFDSSEEATHWISTLENVQCWIATR